MSSFETAFKTFLEGCQKIVTADYERRGLPVVKLGVKGGKRYQKVVELDKAGQPLSAWAFVDKTTGDVLLPASWNAPAKHARGNIFDESNGLKHIGVHGPVYLR